MTALSEKFLEKYFGQQEHPYQTFEKTVDSLLCSNHTLLDAGCGRTAPVLSKFLGKAGRLIGIDLVDFQDVPSDMELYNGDLSHIPLPDQSVDIMMARSVMEHIEQPTAVYREIYRVLKPGGYLVFLTANLWDYASLIAHVTPNRWHPWIVAKTEGRQEHDVFPTQYKTNTYRAICKHCIESGLTLHQFEYLGQYPAYFMFNGFLFLIATGYEKLISRFRFLHFLKGWILATLYKPL
jgi:SAM-dependent methyltransferase